MADPKLEMIRRQLPLGAQIVYGQLKNKFTSARSWDDEELVRYCDWLEKTQWWSRHELDEFQRDQLQLLIRHAYENVPYYRRVFDQRGLKPEDIVGHDGLQKLPLLTKSDVRDNLEDLIARNIDRSSLGFATTSGSTGNPLGIYQDKHNAWVHEMAFHYRQWGWAGYKFGDRFVTLRGNLLPQSDARGERAWWDYNTDRNQLILSSFDMTEKNLIRYVQKIREFRPKFIQAYPSSIEILARFMKRHEIKDLTVRAIFCASETLYLQQRKLIEDQFQCKIFANYGMTEKAVIAFDCEQHQGYHYGMEYGILELLDQYDQPITAPDLPGRVVGTGFDTFGMPLIRYVTDDIAEYASSSCRCGRQSMMIKDFKGRLRELIFSKSGHIISLAPVYASIHGPVAAKIRELKFLQEIEGELVVQIAKVSSFSDAEVEKEFLYELYARLDKKEFNARVVFVDNVPRNARGKLGLLEQRLPVKVEFLDRFSSEISTEV